MPLTQTQVLLIIMGDAVVLTFVQAWLMHRHGNGWPLEREE